MEFHCQSYLQSVADGHAHTPLWLADRSPKSLMVGYLLPLSHPSIFLPSHIVKSPMGTFFLLPHHLSLFSLLLGEKGWQEKREMSTEAIIARGDCNGWPAYEQILLCSSCKELENRNKRKGSAGHRMKTVSHSHTHTQACERARAHTATASYSSS